MVGKASSSSHENSPRRGMPLIRLASRHFLHKSFVNLGRPSRRENHIGVYVNTLRWAGGKIDTESRIGSEQVRLFSRIKDGISSTWRKLTSMSWWKLLLLFWATYVAGSSVIWAGSELSDTGDFQFRSLVWSWLNVGAEVALFALIVAVAFALNKRRA